MIDLKQFEVWFVTGSQHLYGPETLKQVAAHSQEIAAFFDKSENIPIKTVFKPVPPIRPDLLSTPAGFPIRSRKPLLPSGG